MADGAAFRQAILERTAPHTVTSAALNAPQPSLLQPLLPPSPLKGSPYGDVDYIRRAAAEEIGAAELPQGISHHVRLP